MKKNLLVLFFLSFCFVQLLFNRVHAQSGELELKKIDTKEYKVLFYKAFTAETTLQLSAGDLKALTVNSGAGNVLVNGHDSDVISVEANIVISAVSTDRALSIIKKFMSLSLEKEGDRAILESHFDFHKRSNFLEAINPNGFFSAPVRMIDLVVNVPRNLALSVNDRSGDLKIEDIRNNLWVNDRSGNIHINNITGNLTIKDSSGDLALLNVNVGDNTAKTVHIFDKSGAMNLEQINGNLRLKDTSGDLRLVNINQDHGVNKTVRIVDNSGGISLHNVHGDLNLSDTSGDIAMKNIKGNVTLKDSSGGLSIDKIDGDLKLRDSSGDVRANDINGNLTLNDSSGGVYVDYVAKNVHVQDAGSGDLRIKKYGGKITGDLRRLSK